MQYALYLVALTAPAVTHKIERVDEEDDSTSTLVKGFGDDGGVLKDETKAYLDKYISLFAQRPLFLQYTVVENNTFTINYVNITDSYVYVKKFAPVEDRELNLYYSKGYLYSWLRGDTEGSVEEASYTDLVNTYTNPYFVDMTDPTIKEMFFSGENETMSPALLIHDADHYIYLEFASSTDFTVTGILSRTMSIEFTEISDSVWKEPQLPADVTFN